MVVELSGTKPEPTSRDSLGVSAGRPGQGRLRPDV